MPGRPDGRDPTWYKDAVIYELHVRAFCDSDGDGIGDFRGLTEKLGYLHDLGVTAVWLLPFYPSPLRDGGYDIADYTGVHPDYGTLRDFQTFLREAHRCGLRVITELVLNHTSDQHPWFRRAQQAPPGSPQRDFYVWSDSPDRYQGARIIFKDFEPSNWSWNPTAEAYYWHRFYSHQPDLNFDNPEVRRAMIGVVDFWLGLGVDGLRLDAIPYLYEREGTNCENLPETHQFLRQLRRHIDRHYQDRMLLAEANQWPEDAAAYFGAGDECQMAFHFPLMPRLFMAIRTEDRLPVVDIQAQTPSIPETCQWALFLRNHDELTLEMVTEEERLYMYRIYAQAPEARVNLGIRRRLAPLLSNNRRRIELMYGLLFSLPGTPVIYYGDELGMGDNIYLGDRDGVRTPMQWSIDRNAGFSRANPQQLYLPLIVDPEYHHEALNVEAQEHNQSSLLWFVRRLVALRKRFRAFGRGDITFLHPENHHVLAFVRRYQDEQILVVANLSRFVQGVSLDLRDFQGLTPVELFGRTPFWPVSQHPYQLSLGPHAFMLFSLEPLPQVQPVRRVQHAIQVLPALATRRGWESVVLGEDRASLERVLPQYLARQRWFTSKARRLLSARIVEAIPVPTARAPRGYLALVAADFATGDPEIYALPLAFTPDAQAADGRPIPPQARIARLQQRRGRQVENGVLYDAAYHPEFVEYLLNPTSRLRGAAGEAVLVQNAASQPSQAAGRFSDSLSYQEHSNTTILVDNCLSLKLYRRLDSGTHPEVEIGTLLTQRRFPHAPALVNHLEYCRERAEPVTLATAHQIVPHDGTVWDRTLSVLEHYLQQAPGSDVVRVAPSRTPEALLRLAQNETPPEVARFLGGYLETVRLLGRRTAELHRALAADESGPSFAPEPFTSFYQRSRYQAVRGAIGRVFRTLRHALPQLAEPAASAARELLEHESELRGRFHWMLDYTIPATRIRCHGNYHLQQVLCSQGDLVILDFEGEPSRPLAERRLKQSPLRDVADLLRSFDYAARWAVLAAEQPGSAENGPASDRLQRAQAWYVWVAAEFLRAYLGEAQDQPSLLPPPDHLALLLEAKMLEKAVHEVGYELDGRPDWLAIPLFGLLDLLNAHPPTGPQDQ